MKHESFLQTEEDQDSTERNSHQCFPLLNHLHELVAQKNNTKITNLIFFIT